MFENDSTINRRKFYLPDLPLRFIKTDILTRAGQDMTSFLCGVPYAYILTKDKNYPPFVQWGMCCLKFGNLWTRYFLPKDENRYYTWISVRRQVIYSPTHGDKMWHRVFLMWGCLRKLLPDPAITLTLPSVFHQLYLL